MRHSAVTTARDELASDSDAVGTGERASVGTGRDQPDTDILPDHIERVTGADLDKDLDDTAGDGLNGLSEV